MNYIFYNFRFFLVQVVSVCTNTETTATDVKEIQAATETLAVGIQVQCSTVNQEIQTSLLKSQANQLIQTDKCKRNNLGVQLLPQINIHSTFVVQKLLVFSINQDGATEILYKSEKPNTLFTEVTHDLPSLSFEATSPIIKYFKAMDSDVSTSNNTNTYNLSSGNSSPRRKASKPDSLTR